MKLKTIVVTAAASLLLSACAVTPAFRAHPNLEARAKEIRASTLLPPKVEVFQLDAGGVKEKMDDWTAQAKKNIIAALEQELGGVPGVTLKTIPEDSMLEDGKFDLEETYVLFEALNKSIVMHTYSPPSRPELIFEEKIKNFDYSLGREVQKLAGASPDTVLVIRAVDHVWTEGRRALQFLGVLLGVGAGAATGVMVIPVLGGATELEAALADARTGNILWYNRVAKGTGADLRDRESAASLIKELFKDYPVGKEKR